MILSHSFPIMSVRIWQWRSDNCFHRLRFG